MSFNTAHEGYEYQDLLTSYFILQEILNESDAEFKIDTKEHSDDKFDDLTIHNSFGIFKKQIKYSNEISNHIAQKVDFSNSNNYDLAIYDLFYSWRGSINKPKEIRICLAWKEPTDKLTNFLINSSKEKTFKNYPTAIFQFDINKLWPRNKLPENSWRKFINKSENINRDEFIEFCSHLVIETNFPKQSFDKSFNGELEKIILNQINKLGIGEYPNNHITPKHFALELLKLVTRSRSRGLKISTKEIFKSFNIQTDFGSIEQVFPIDESKNIDTKDIIFSFLYQIKQENRVILKGEPGSGKSWFVQNLQKELSKEGISIVKHYCYTELRDIHAKKRITLNVFYANLINEIISIFPDLIKRKKKKYASNLEELNELLKWIDEQTIIIIDGLDHIERIYADKQTDLTLSDIAIIEAINELKTNKNVKILLVSQPIKKLIILSDYKIYDIPKWTKKEVLQYFKRNGINNYKISDNYYLSDFLTEKSDGNPLYLNYLVKEVKKIISININTLNQLPSYNYNLKDYYEYLIKKIDFNTAIPQILSGVQFSLSKKELKEISGQGKLVDKALNTLFPILKQIYSNGEYIIYHESFRRFIIEKLVEEKVDTKLAIFKPIIEWFSRKDFFDFPKAYRYYFQVLYDIGKFNQISSFLKKDFITKSIYYGNSFDAIKNNYYYLVKAVIKEKNFPKTILANELKKVIISTEYEYYENYPLYFSALGHLKGFKKVSEYLVFNEKPTLPLKVGLEACYLCSQNKEPAPWNIYFDYFKKNKEISITDFKYYIRGLLVFRNGQKLIKIAIKIYANYSDYTSIFKNELQEYPDKDYINDLIDKNDIFNRIINYKEKFKVDDDIISLCEKLLKKDNIFDDDLPLLISFFKLIENNIKDEHRITSMIEKFSGVNWFYNWLIYYIKIKQLPINYKYTKVKEAFKYLTYDTEPFKGNPRTLDLYSARDFIYNSINEGLKFVEKECEWEEIINILKKLSIETTTFFQKSAVGPLSTEKLFQLLDNNSNEINRKNIIQVFEKLIKKKQNYYLHSYITEFYFRLSKQYSIVGEKDKSERSFSKGLQFYLSYGFRRDRTLEDLIYAIKSYVDFNFEKGNNDIKKIKSLVDAVVNHTDGKDTKWFPVEWYQKYLKINFNKASLYLLSQIKENYYWIYEEQLQDLLIEANGNINPITEVFLFLTYPIETSEEFLLYGLTLIEKTKIIDNSLAKILLSNIMEKTNLKKEQNFSNDFVEKFNSKLNEFNLSTERLKQNTNSTKNNYGSNKKLTDVLNEKYVHRKEFSEMNIKEMIEYYSKNKIKKTELISLYYYFDNIDNLTDNLKELIKTIVEQQEKYPKNDDIDLSVIFQKNNDISAFYWVIKFITEQDDWFNNLVNISAFEKAYAINPKLAINSLISYLEKFIKPDSYNRSVSANLINAFIKIGYKKDVIESMWNNLFEATDFRLPAKDKIEWDKILKDDLKMNIEEIFICLLFSRFNSNTTERHHWTLAGLYYMFDNFPEKMIKPTKWFLKNEDNFLTSNLVIILEILYDNKDAKYIQNFYDELYKFYHSKYYIINYLLENLFPKKIIVQYNSSKLFYPVEQKSVEFFVNINYRNKILNSNGFSFETVVGKYKNTFRKKYGDEFEFLYNRAMELLVKNIFSANYLIELINDELYEELDEYPDKKYLYDFLKVEYKTIVAQILSYIKRPSDIIRPNEIQNIWERGKIIENNWIRLGYIEYELYGEKYNKNGLNNYIIFEGIVFSDNLEETIPFSKYRLFSVHLWDNLDMKDFDEFLCVSLIQKHDTLENFYILWLNSIIFNELNLKIGEPSEGLIAKDNQGEEILKLNRWISDYIGNDDVVEIADEIPRLEGAELICRKDYFDKICELFKPHKPYRYRLKL